MIANKQSLAGILSIDVRLVAPLFQRPYVWSQSDNWEPLWASLVDVFESRLNNDEPRPYFMGAVVLDKPVGSIGRVPSREIIDGQQRLTTLQLLMQSAYVLFRDLELEHQANQLHRLIRNDLEEVSDEQFKIWPTNVDRAAFRAAMTGSNTPGRFGEAFSFFTQVISEWIGSNPDELRRRASAVVESVKHDLLFVAIDLDNDDDGQLIFETLNSLGTPLLPSDLVKNLLFREASATKLDSDALYESHWAHFEQDEQYWRELVSVGRRERTRLDVFLQFYLTYKLEDEPRMAQLFRAYRDWFRKGAFGSVEEAVADFSNHAKLFKTFDTARVGVEGSLRHVLDVLDSSVPNPLVLGFMARVNDLTERHEMMRILESYLMRRFLCGLGTKQYNRTVFEVKSYLNQPEVGWNAESLRNRLLQFSGNNAIWPDDGWVIWRQKEKSAYGNIRGIGIGLALSRVEAATRSEKSELPWNTRTPMTLEHILPQKWQEHWPLAPDAPEDAVQIRADHIDRMGNLTVLTRKLNSSISNSAWSVKKKHLNDHTVLLINSALTGKETWSENDIVERGEKLGLKFCELWPREQGG